MTVSGEKFAGSLGALLLASAQALAADSTTQPPTTAPTTIAATTVPTSTPAGAKVAEDALPVLEELSEAYAASRALSLEGKIVGRFDVAGRQKTYSLHITGRTDGSGKFRHEAQGTGILISDGNDAYIFDAKRNSFGHLPTSAGRQAPEDLDESIINVLLDENPALLLSITTNASDLLKRVADAITLKNADGVRLVLGLDRKQVLLKLDPVSHLIVESTIEYTPLLKDRGATVINSASAVLKYDTPAAWTPTEDAFRWVPPSDATEFQIGSELLKEISRPARPTTRP